MLAPDASDRVRVRLRAKISPEARSRPGCASGRVGEKTRRGRAGGFLAAFWRFLGVFSRPGGKSRKPPPPGIEPTTVPVFGRGVTATPGPQLRSDQGGPEPHLPRPDDNLPARIRARARVGRIRGKKGPRRELGSAHRPVRAKCMAAPATRPERPDLCLKRRLVFRPNPNPTRTLPPPVSPESLIDPGS